MRRVSRHLTGAQSPRSLDTEGLSTVFCLIEIAVAARLAIESIDRRNR